MNLLGRVGFLVGVSVNPFWPRASFVAASKCKPIQNHIKVICENVSSSGKQLFLPLSCNVALFDVTHNIA